MPEINKEQRDMRNKIKIITTTLLMSIASSIAVAESKQAKWIGDLPIMPKLQIEQGIGFAFDSSEGRIVTIFLSGDTTKIEIEKYYKNAMEPLGWMQLDSAKWAREDEILKIEETEALSTKLWKITIRPN